MASEFFFSSLSAHGKFEQKFSFYFKLNLLKFAKIKYYLSIFTNKSDIF